MNFKHSMLALALSSAPLLASAEIVVYHQDFENGLNAHEEIVFADSSTRWVGGNSAAITGRNWDVHHKSTNPWVAGGGLSGNVLGHVYADYNVFEDNYFQVNDISLASLPDHVTLSFDFDSWIFDDVDGFAVSVCTSWCVNSGAESTSHGFQRINPTAASDMQYQNLSAGENYDPSLNRLSDGTSSGNVIGFNGHEWNSQMTGTAMFDLSAYAGQTIALRFSFASDSSMESGFYTNAEGINIDNIKIVAKCANGSTAPDCSQNNTGIPEPTSMSLALLGLAGLYRRRQTGRWL